MLKRLADRLLKKIRPRDAFGLALFAFLVVVHLLMSAPVAGIQLNCDSLRSVKSKNNWQVADSKNVQANVLWEKSVYVQDALMAASDKYLLINQGVLGCPDDNSIIAFVDSTGKNAWESPIQSMNVIRGITRVTDGFLVTLCCTSINKLDDQGAELWQAVEVPARMYRPALFVTEDNVYLPTTSQVHVFALDDGREQPTIDAPNALAVFSDFVLVNSKGKTLEVRNLQSGDIQWTAQLPRENTFSNYSVFRFDNVVLIAWSLRQIDAYQLDTGEKLSSISDNLLATPINVGNLLLTYNSDRQLIFYDKQGQVVASLSLTTTTPNPRQDALDIAIGAILAASDNEVFIWDNQVAELVAISYQLDNSTSS